MFHFGEHKFCFERGGGGGVLSKKKKNLIEKVQNFKFILTTLSLFTSLSFHPLPLIRYRF